LGRRFEGRGRRDEYEYEYEYVYECDYDCDDERDCGGRSVWGETPVVAAPFPTSRIGPLH
jgi:hypothetical protein